MYNFFLKKPHTDTWHVD